MKWILLLGIGGILGFAVFAAWMLSIPPENHGLTTGYYGELNTIRYALEEIPGITVLDFGGNRDISLEEFAVEVMLENGDKLCLAFMERDPVRSLRGEALKQALQDKIDTMLENGLEPYTQCTAWGAYDSKSGRFVDAE